MLRCFRCGRANPLACRYCADCGAGLPSPLGAGTRLEGRYELARPLTRAGRAPTTFLARDTQGDQPVVVKEVRGDLARTAEAKHDFQEALRSAALLTGVSVPGVRRVLTHEGRQYLVLDYLSGQSLRTVLASKGRIPPEIGRRVALAALKALGQLHERGLCHGRLSPEHLLLQDWDRVSLLDGLWLRRLGNPHTLVEELGSSPYAAPEARHGEFTVAGDMYALGAVLVEALAGELRYGAGAGRLVWPSLDGSLEALLSRLTEPRADMRFPSVAHAVHALASPPVEQQRHVPAATPAAAAAPAPVEAPAPAAPTQLQSLEQIGAVSEEDGLAAVMALYESQNS